MAAVGSLLGAKTPAEVFSVVDTKERNQVLKVVKQEDVSLGLVDPTTGRSLLYKLLTSITNGDKIAHEKLDACVTASGDDSDDDGYAVGVDHRYLVDEDPRNMVLVKDLLQLPKETSTKVLSHPVITTFIEKRWSQTRWSFLVSFSLYLVFVLLFSSFLWLMYERYEEHEQIRIEVERPNNCDLLTPIKFPARGPNKEIKSRMIGGDIEGIDISTGTGLSTRGRRVKENKDEDEFELHVEVVKKRKDRTKASRVKKKFVLFSGCSASKRLRDVDLCTIEILLVVSIVVLVMQEFWQCMALGRHYFMELENWFELLILSLATSTLSLKTQLDSLQIVSAVGICLAWIELIFLFGRYPFLGGSFSIMYYSITKRIIKTALGFVILICAFTFAFFIIHFGNETESFDNVGRAFLKIFVMILGEFEFDDLWSNSASSNSVLSRVITMVLLSGLIILGSMIMVNLIVAIIISDIEWLNKTSKEQSLINQAHHAVQIYALQALFQCLSRKVQDKHTRKSSFPSLSTLQMSVCVHSVCQCPAYKKTTREVQDQLVHIISQKK
jgi:hypothetical protein